MSSIKINNAALQDAEGKIVLRGTVDNASLTDLQIGTYQREVLPFSTLKRIEEALEANVVLPDIELGSRGQNFRTREGSTYLQDPTYIIDGLQRVTAAIRLYKQNKLKVPIGCTIHFDTDEKWERARFKVLNVSRVKLSPSILLRNQTQDSTALEVLYNLCYDRSFALNKKVCWQQNMARGELITALTLSRVAAKLHMFCCAASGSNTDLMVQNLDKALNHVGRNTFRANIFQFYEVIDACFGLRRIFFRENTPQVKLAFLTSTAMLFARHFDFWRGENSEKFFVDTKLQKKLSQFSIADPSVGALAGGNSKAIDMLYFMLVEHMNKGKVTKHLKSRLGPVEQATEEELSSELSTEEMETVT